MKRPFNPTKMGDYGHIFFFTLILILIVIQPFDHSVRNILLILVSSKFDFFLLRLYLHVFSIIPTVLGDIRDLICFEHIAKLLLS
jgi:formate/nitrite transporter FocA (FNT family)